MITRIEFWTDELGLRGSVKLDGKEVENVAGVTVVTNVGEITEVTLRLRPTKVEVIGVVPYLVMTGPNGEDLLTRDGVGSK